MKVDTLFEDKNPIVISSITLNELENIKTSTNKDADVKYAARKLLHLLDEHPDDYEVWIFKNNMLDPIIDKDLSITNDTSILATAIDYDKNCHPDETIFVTNDLALKHIANLFFGSDSIESVEEETTDDYSGYLEISMSDNLMTEFYSQPSTNMFNLKINQYLVVSNTDNEIVDTLCWTGEGYRHLNYKNFNSRYLGDVKPFKGDIYQAMLADSLINNKITLVKGPAGSGKTFLSLSYLLSQLDKGRIDKIIVFCNTVATKNSAKLGYYPGTRDEKLLDS
jgi:predicted ribonuclease YlaK